MITKTLPLLIVVPSKLLLALIIGFVTYKITYFAADSIALRVGCANLISGPQPEICSNQIFKIGLLSSVLILPVIVFLSVYSLVGRIAKH